MSMDEYREFCPEFEDGIYPAIDLINCVNGRKVTGGPAAVRVSEQIALCRDFLDKHATKHID